MASSLSAPSSTASPAATPKEQQLVTKRVTKSRMDLMFPFMGGPVLPKGFRPWKKVDLLSSLAAGTGALHVDSLITEGWDPIKCSVRLQQPDLFSTLRETNSVIFVHEFWAPTITEITTTGVVRKESTLGKLNPAIMVMVEDNSHLLTDDKLIGPFSRFKDDPALYSELRTPIIGYALGPTYLATIEEPSPSTILVRWAEKKEMFDERVAFITDIIINKSPSGKYLFKESITTPIMNVDPPPSIGYSVISLRRIKNTVSSSEINSKRWGDLSGGGTSTSVPTHFKPSLPPGEVNSPDGAVPLSKDSVSAINNSTAPSSIAASFSSSSSNNNDPFAIIVLENGCVATPFYLKTLKNWFSSPHYLEWRESALLRNFPATT